MPDRPSCTGATTTGRPCRNKPKPGTDRCGKHPLNAANLHHMQRDSRQAAFLAAFSEAGNVSESAAAAGIDRSLHYHWIDDPDYRAAFESARQTAADRLEREAVRRARDGVEEPVWFKGEEVGTQLRYSDTLLMFLLNGWRPEVYTRQRTVVHAGAGFDESGRPFASVEVESGADALADAFASYRDEVGVIDVESSPAD